MTRFVWRPRISPVSIRSLAASPPPRVISTATSAPLPCSSRSTPARL